MQPLVLQESINLCDAQRKSYLILEFMSMSFLPATPVRQEQVVWWAYTAGGTVATLHVTRTAITEEHMNRLNMCIRNTLMLLLLVQFSSVSHACFFASPWTAAHQASLSITNSRSLVKLMSIDLVMPSNQLILCHPLLLTSTIPSIRVFSNESVLHVRWTEYWSFSFSISPSNEYSGLISFRMDWFDLLAVQGTLKSLLQHHSSKASILQRSAFFTVQLSDPSMTTWKIIALTIRLYQN